MNNQNIRFRSSLEDFGNFQLSMALQRLSEIFRKCLETFLCILINPFSAKGFPFDEYNRLALDRVKSISTSLALKGLREIGF